MGIKIEPYKIKKDTRLYRFLNIKPEEFRYGMSRNCGKDGRCNLHRDIYYCCGSIDAILQEYIWEDLNGIIVPAVVKHTIICGKVVDEETHVKLRGRVNEEPDLIHKEVLAPLGKDVVTSYEETNKIADEVIKKFPHGLVYSSVHSIDTVIGNNIFNIGEEMSYSNIALTEGGFKYIKQLQPYEFRFRQ